MYFIQLVGSDRTFTDMSTVIESAVCDRFSQLLQVKRNTDMYDNVQLRVLKEETNYYGDVSYVDVSVDFHALLYGTKKVCDFRDDDDCTEVATHSFGLYDVCANCHRKLLVQEDR